MIGDEMQKEVFFNPECGIGGIPVNKDVLAWNFDQVVTDKAEGDGDEKPVSQGMENPLLHF